MERIKILLADDHRMIRDGIRALLEKEPDIELIAEADNGRTAVILSRKFKPDVVIMDINMPDLNGVEATAKIISEVPGIRVVALSMNSDRRFVTRMLKAGASSYILKECAFEELAFAIRAAAAGQTYLSPKIAGTVVKDYVNRLSENDMPMFSELSEREREVLQLITEGKSTKDIADHLHVSIKTIETHRKNIMDKLNIHTIAELTKYAIREGLTAL